MISRTETVGNENGLHCAPVSKISAIIRGYSGKVTLTSPAGVSVNGRSVLQILAMGLKHGDALTVTVEGDDEERIESEIAAIINQATDY